MSGRTVQTKIFSKGTWYKFKSASKRSLKPSFLVYVEWCCCISTRPYFGTSTSKFRAYTIWYRWKTCAVARLRFAYSDLLISCGLFLQTSICVGRITKSSFLAQYISWTYRSWTRMRFRLHTWMFEWYLGKKSLFTQQASELPPHPPSPASASVVWSGTAASGEKCETEIATAQRRR